MNTDHETIATDDGVVYAIAVSAKSVTEGSEWFGDSIESIQAQRFKFPVGKVFRPHRHILNPRIIRRTQEAFVVVSGRIAVDVYISALLTKRHRMLGTLEAGPGDLIIIYRGGHGIRVLEDCVCYEVKAGQYTVVSEDKIDIKLTNIK